MPNKTEFKTVFDELKSILKPYARKMDVAQDTDTYYLLNTRHIMKTLANHCCPNCSHPVGAKRWLWRAWIWARWNCGSCGAPLRFDSRRRILMSLAMGLFFVATLATGAACMFLRISPWIWGAPLFIAYILGSIFIGRHGDRIALATNNPAPH